jgi:hypothetical protein
LRRGREDNDDGSDAEEEEGTEREKAFFGFDSCTTTLLVGANSIRFLSAHGSTTFERQDARVDREVERMAPSSANHEEHRGERREGRRETRPGSLSLRNPSTSSIKSFEKQSQRRGPRMDPCSAPRSISIDGRHE